MTASEQTDLLVIGGGVNGTGIARDAAGRGLKVVLCERDDLGSATSSASTKLIHGGLRYLEYFEFRLVRESLAEREVMLRSAPHIIWPLRFILPHHRELRPAWLLRLGLFLYDHLGGRRLLPSTRMVKLRDEPQGIPLKPTFTKAFEYSDCWVEDSRLVVLVAKDAAERGAKVLTRTACTGLRRECGLWHATLSGAQGVRRVIARAVVNAAGPWVAKILSSISKQGHTLRSVRLIKGSHIVVPKMYEGEHCYIFQNADGRIIFAIPYERDFTLIGTTELAYDGDPSQVSITEQERDYLCAAASEYFVRPILADQVKWTYSGVRPLYDDTLASPSAVTRDYMLDLDQPNGQAPILSVFGGKITTYRKLAERAVSTLLPLLGRKAPAWTRGVPLPGGEIADARFEEFLSDMVQSYPWAPVDHLRRLCRAYGTRVGKLIGGAKAWTELGRDFGAGLTETEIRYLQEHEWAETAEDILWRRSKLGLRMTEVERTSVRDWLNKGPCEDSGRISLGSAAVRHPPTAP